MSRVGVSRVKISIYCCFVFLVRCMLADVYIETWILLIIFLFFFICQKKKVRLAKKKQGPRKCERSGVYKPPRSHYDSGVSRQGE